MGVEIRHEWLDLHEALSKITAKKLGLNRMMQSAPYDNFLWGWIIGN